MVMKMSIKQFADMLKECNSIVFFGGAGVSTESGVKDYRSQDGLYNTVKEYGVPPEEILSHSFFFQHPETFYDFYRKYFIIEVEPNNAHKALAKLETMGKLKAVITQNIDGLHQKAGSKNVIELHGTAGEFNCGACGKSADTEEVIETIKSGIIPKCKYCRGLMKPKVVLYEEPLYDGVAESAVESIASADMLIVGGTSLAVYPAASIVRYFKGKYIVMINKTETKYDNNADLVIRENIGDVMDKVLKFIKKN
ncbi:MAG: NAD-dependent protein deacylase [Clostridia bacterium]|nr:NAD-dependent protein deacylase [Clostridia bacterium]